jgi:hypothetical protein
MATAKPAATTRRSSTGKSTKKGPEPEISAARWAGVALVIAAIIGAIILAVISPSDRQPSAPAIAPVASASPGPAASPNDAPVPTERLSIVAPISGITPEVDIEVTVAVPEIELPKKQVAIVILRNGERVETSEKFKTGARKVIGGVRLLEGHNELTAALQGPGGDLGPLSEPVVMTVDFDVPSLAITSPKNKTRTFAEVIEVAGTSEPGAVVRIQNATADYDQEIVVGPNGKYGQVVPLKKGPNKVSVTSTSAAGIPKTEEVNVVRKDGKPEIELLSPPKTIKRSSLPREVKLSVRVTDSAGDNMEGAVVSYSLSGRGRITQTAADETNANGRSNWVVEVKPVDSGSSTLLLTVEVTSPYDLRRSVTHEIAIS